MATFPALVPSAAPTTPGAWPVLAITSVNGAEARIRQGSAQIGRRLRLTFPNVTEANFLAILAHYQGQRSGFDPFGFDTTTLAADLTPSGHAWLYASRPQVIDEHLDVFTVACEFKSEPRGLVVAAGKTWRTSQTLLSRAIALGNALSTAETVLATGGRNSGVGSRGVSLGPDLSQLRPQAAPDPFFSSVLFLCGFNKANGSTAFVDEGPLGLSFAALGSAQVSTAQSVSGGSSLTLNGSSAVRLPSDSRLNISGDFTLDVRCRFSTTNSFAILGGDGVSVGFYRSATTLQTLLFAATRSVAFASAVDTWYALRWARSGSTLYTFADGVLLGSSTLAGTFVISNGMIGHIGSGLTGTFNGYIDEIRLSTVCRSTASYTLDATPLSRV
jgi:hypothetical protein